MSGLYFKYGTMNSSKTANLLMIKHNYEEQNISVIVLKPCIDTRDEDKIKDGIGVVSSRVGISSDCHILYDDSDIVELTKGYDVIMVDESQFLTAKQVGTLYEISFEKVVMCFGLLTDFKRELFEGSKRLIELCDSLQEIKSICKCGKRAVVNARYTNGVIQTSGEQIQVNSLNDKSEYKALCKQCYNSEICRNVLADALDIYYKNNSTD